jgi:hypothetical protein
VVDVRHDGDVAKVGVLHASTGGLNTRARRCAGPRDGCGGIVFSTNGPGEVSRWGRGKGEEWGNRAESTGAGAAGQPGCLVSGPRRNRVAVGSGRSGPPPALDGREALLRPGPTQPHELFARPRPHDEQVRVGPQ